MPILRFRIRTLMIAVGAAALIALVATSHEPRDEITDKRVVIPITCVIGAVYGVGAMRRPVQFLAPLLVVWIVSPTVDHPSQDVVSASHLACIVAWAVGAPIGWICREGTNTVESVQVEDEPRDPNKLWQNSSGMAFAPWSGSSLHCGGYRCGQCPHAGGVL
jgi:hypothetical protein